MKAYTLNALFEICLYNAGNLTIFASVFEKTQGEMSEWFKEHAWKVCIRHKRIRGSNPRLSA